MQVHQVSGQWISMAITIAIVAVVMLVRLRRLGKVRRLRLETLWIIPAIYAALMVYVFRSQMPHGLAWLYCALGLAIGSALGWQRGKLMAISVDPDTHELNQTMSPAALLFILGLVVLRSGSRMMAQSMGLGHGGLMIATDVLMAFGLGFLTVQRVEMFLRARRMLGEARAARPR